MTSPRGWRLRANLAPARLVAGMRIEHVADDFRSITVALVPRWYGGGTAAPHGGAALYAMVDPYFVFMVQRALGNDFLVWDKAGSIEVHAPGRGRVWARLELHDEDLRHMRQMTDAGDKHLHLFAAEVRDGDGMAIARVEKMVYVRRKGNAT
jgi:hypothetical protein